MNLQRAIEIAAEAHRGQTDKAGTPYFLHPLRVMMALETEVERIVGVLHDVVEDCPEWSFDRLANEGFEDAVLTALQLVTKRPEDKGTDEASYLRFVLRTVDNPIARRVKIADIRDNLNVARLQRMSDADLQRVNKYLAALRLLTAA